MTKNNIITNSHKINILNQDFTIPIAPIAPIAPVAPIAIGGITKESQKLSLNSTKVNIKHTKEPSVLILA
jgi:hypothetical protein